MSASLVRRTMARAAATGWSLMLAVLLNKGEAENIFSPVAALREFGRIVRRVAPRTNATRAIAKPVERAALGIARREA